MSTPTAGPIEIPQLRRFIALIIIAAQQVLEAIGPQVVELAGLEEWFDGDVPWWGTLAAFVVAAVAAYRARASRLSSSEIDLARQVLALAAGDGRDE